VVSGGTGTPVVVVSTGAAGVVVVATGDVVSGVVVYVTVVVVTLTATGEQKQQLSGMLTNLSPFLSQSSWLIRHWS